MTLEQLMDQRHQTYKAAFAKGFQNTELTEAWRAANRAYVEARVPQRPRFVPVAIKERAKKSLAETMEQFRTD